MSTHIALLRGINLAGRRRVAMATLRHVLTDLGYANLRTLGQSGNVVLENDGPASGLEAALTRGISDGLGMAVEVIVRSREELAEVLTGDPLGALVTDPRRYQVSFLAGPLDRRRARELESLELTPERIVLREREIYAWHPAGIARSPLAALLTAQRLGVGVTARNWNTIARLVAIADGD